MESGITAIDIVLLTSKKDEKLPQINANNLYENNLSKLLFNALNPTDCEKMDASAEPINSYSSK